MVARISRVAITFQSIAATTAIARTSCRGITNAVFNTLILVDVIAGIAIADICVAGQLTNRAVGLLTWIGAAGRIGHTHVQLFVEAGIALAGICLSILYADRAIYCDAGIRITGVKVLGQAIQAIRQITLVTLIAVLSNVARLARANRLIIQIGAASMNTRVGITGRISLAFQSI